MSSPTDLSDLAQQVLRILLLRGSIDGSSLLREIRNTAPDNVAAAINELRRKRFVEVGGSVNPDELPFSRFAVLPSAKSYINSILP